jgi:hypothetical protein
MKTLRLQNIQGSPKSEMPGSNSETWGTFCDGFTLHGQITARDRLGNHVHPTIKTLFLKNSAVFQGDRTPIHTAGNVQSWL